MTRNLLMLGVAAAVAGHGRRLRTLVFPMIPGLHLIPRPVSMTCGTTCSRRPANQPPDAAGYPLFLFPLHLRHRSRRLHAEKLVDGDLVRHGCRLRRASSIRRWRSTAPTVPCFATNATRALMSGCPGPRRHPRRRMVTTRPAATPPADRPRNSPAMKLLEYRIAAVPRARNPPASRPTNR